MTEGPLIIILKMFSVLISSTVSTVSDIIGLAGDLLKSLFFVSSVGGALGFWIAVVVIFVAGFFLIKFFFSSFKTVAILSAVFIVLLILFILGLAAFA